MTVAAGDSRSAENATHSAGEPDARRRELFRKAGILWCASADLTTYGVPKQIGTTAWTTSSPGTVITRSAGTGRGRQDHELPRPDQIAAPVLPHFGGKEAEYHDGKGRGGRQVPEKNRQAVLPASRFLSAARADNRAEAILRLYPWTRSRCQELRRQARGPRRPGVRVPAEYGIPRSSRITGLLRPRLLAVPGRDRADALEKKRPLENTIIVCGAIRCAPRRTGVWQKMSLSRSRRACRSSSPRRGRKREDRVPAAGGAARLYRRLWTGRLEGAQAPARAAASAFPDVPRHG